MPRPLRLKPSRNKYGARRTVYNGVTYHSKREAEYAANLDLQKKVGKIFAWDRQRSVPLEVNGIYICSLVVDFIVWLPEPCSGPEYHEVKGAETGTWKLKEKLFRAIYPNRKLVVVR